MLTDDVLIKYSELSASNTFHLNDYIQFTLSADTCSIDDSNTKIKATVYDKNKTGTHLKPRT